MTNKDDRDALTDPDGKSKAYQSKVPTVARRMAKAVDSARKSTAQAVMSILGDLKSAGTFTSKKQAYDWLKKTPTMDAVWALVEQAQSIQDDARRDLLMRRIMSGAKVARMSRLDALNASLAINKEIIVEGVKRNVTPVIKSVTKDAYYRQTFTLQKQVGVGWTFDEPPAGQIVKGMTSDLEKMADWYHGPLDKDLRDTIVEGIATGKTPAQIAKVLERQEVPPARAKAVARTMLTTVSNEAEMEALKKTRIKRYEYVATLDERTCPVCGGLDGRTFPLDDARAGINFPPMHPNCRCVHIASLSKDIKAELTRSARDEHGRTREVPADMTYAEWLRKYGSKRAQDRFAKPAKVPQAKKKVWYEEGREVPTRERATIMAGDFDDHFRNKKGKVMVANLADAINAKEDADPNAIAVIKNISRHRNSPDLKVQYSSKCYVERSMSRPILSIPDQTIEGRPKEGLIGTTCHEMTHLSDYYHRSEEVSLGMYSRENKAYSDAIKEAGSGMSEEVEALFKDFNAKCDENLRIVDKEIMVKDAELEAEFRKVQNELMECLPIPEKAEPLLKRSKELREASDRLYKDRMMRWDDMNRSMDGGCINQLEDIYDALSEGQLFDSRKVKYGHGYGKCYKFPGKAESEILANYVSLSINRPDLVQMLKRDKPELCRELDRIVYHLGEEPHDWKG